MGCACGAGTGGGIAYRVLVPGQPETYVATIGEAKMMRQASVGVVVEARPQSDMDTWRASQPSAVQDAG